MSPDDVDVKVFWLIKILFLIKRYWALGIILKYRLLFILEYFCEKY